MSTLSLLLVLALAQAKDTPSNKYMAPACYPAASAKEDPMAVGGHSVATNKPRPLGNARVPGAVDLYLSPTAREAGLMAQLRNGTANEEWFRAADGNLQAYLEAKDESGAWRPVQFHHWAWCGNSWHRVLLPARHYWSFLIPMPKGSFKTRLRLRLKNEDYVLTSNEVEAQIPKEKFKLAPELAKTHRIHQDWGVPTLASQDGPIK
jgi:hypothetical protein